MADLIRHRIHHRQYIVAMFSFSDRCTDPAAKYIQPKIKLFFDAVQDKDNMLYFPEVNVSKEQEQLNRSLNRLNDLLARTKGENQKQEHFYRSLLEEVPSGVLAWMFQAESSLPTVLPSLC